MSNTGGSIANTDSRYFILDWSFTSVTDGVEQGSKGWELESVNMAEFNPAQASNEEAVGDAPLADGTDAPLKSPGDPGAIEYFEQQIPVVAGPPKKRSFEDEFMRPAYEQGDLEDVPLRAGYSKRAISEE